MTQGVETESEAEVSADQIAEQVAGIHQQLDQFKEWSQEVVDWLEGERARLRDEGDRTAAAQTLKLIEYVESVYLRIELGDRQMQPEEDDDGDEI